MFIEPFDWEGNLGFIAERCRMRLESREDKSRQGSAVCRDGKVKKTKSETSVGEHDEFDVVRRR